MTAYNNEKSSNELLDLLNSVEGAASIAVASTAVVYGKSFALPKNKSFGGIFRASSSGTVNLKVELEVGNNELTAAQEGQAVSTWAVAQTIDTLVATAAVAKAVSPVVARYGRLKLTGLSGNHASTALAQAELGISKNQ